MGELRFHDGLAAVYECVTVVNGYLTEQEPWQVAKRFDSDPSARARVDTTLYTAAEGLRALAVLLAPVLPKAASQLWESLGASAVLGALVEQRVQDAGRWGQLLPGATVTKGAALFPRLEEPPTPSA